ncbi:MAG TPA: 2-nitropropane dioxygenase [Rhodospirillaceae bacterium]|nr:MAG: 2-nitropropane dioxygenase [Alphaproteobacteria bacterium GWF2_58_20]HAU29230.1 2-nitropropane dioxygenase [Rhodospirillaceae bacterium]
MTNHDQARARLEELWAPGCRFLGCRFAVMGGAMSWVSERNLVSAISSAGGFGVLAGGSMDPDRLDVEIEATQKMTKAPFGVNLITMHPRLPELVNVCLARKVSHIVFAGGVPGREMIALAKAGGAKVVCFAPALALAKRLVRSGADALILEGSEAGGHIGPVATSVLVQEILPQVRDVPVFVAGGIGRGEAMLSYLEMGAAGVQLGTRFVVATESVAHPAFKKAFITASARDAMPTVQVDARFPVIPVRAIENEGSRQFMMLQHDVASKVDRGEITQQEGHLTIEKYWVGSLRRAVVDGDVEHGSLMAGQSVGMVVREQPVADILAEIEEQAIAALVARGG